MNGDPSGLVAHARRLRVAAEATRARARRLGAQAEATRWEGVAAIRFLTGLGIVTTEAFGLALAAERAAEALEAHAARVGAACSGVAP